MNETMYILGELLGFFCDCGWCQSTLPSIFTDMLFVVQLLVKAMYRVLSVFVGSMGLIQVRAMYGVLGVFVSSIGLIQVKAMYRVLGVFVSSMGLIQVQVMYGVLGVFSVPWDLLRLRLCTGYWGICHFQWNHSGQCYVHVGVVSSMSLIQVKVTHRIIEVFVTSTGLTQAKLMYRFVLSAP